MLHIHIPTTYSSQIETITIQPLNRISKRSQINTKHKTPTEIQQITVIHCYTVIFTSCRPKSLSHFASTYSSTEIIFIKMLD